MSLSGTRGLVRVSKNLKCEVQAAMALERVREPEFFQRVTGAEYPGEYGERYSARRRGTKFESNLMQNNAALLRRALAPMFGFDAEQMWVRNFGEEIPGPPGEMRAMRIHRTRLILRDLTRGAGVPELLIQPQLRLRTGPGDRDFEHVSPDFMVLDPRVSMYVVGEEKSFIARAGVAEPGDLDLTRRQAAAGILGLRYEASRVGVVDRVSNRAVFVVATPWGLAPADPVEELLDAEVHEIERAVAFLAQVRQRLAEVRGVDRPPLENVIDDLEVYFQEGCFGSCILASVCEQRFAGRARLLGDRAVELFGPDIASTRLVALANGARPRGAHERAIAARLVDAAAVLGHLPRAVANP